MVVSGLTGLRSHHPGSLRAGERCAGGLGRPVPSPPLSELEPASCAAAVSAQSGGPLCRCLPGRPLPSHKATELTPCRRQHSGSCPCARGWEQALLLWSLPEITPRLPGIRDKERVHQYLGRGCSGTPALASLCCCREGAPAFHPLLGELCVGRGLFSRPAP